MDKHFKDELAFDLEFEKLAEYVRLKSKSREKGIPFIFNTPSEITEDFIKDEPVFVCIFTDPIDDRTNGVKEKAFISTISPLMNYPSEPLLTRKQRRSELYTKNKKWYHQFNRKHF